MKFEDGSTLWGELDREVVLIYETGSSRIKIPLAGFRDLRIRLDELDHLVWEGSEARALSAYEKEGLREKLIRFAEANEGGARYFIDNSPRTEPAFSYSAAEYQPRDFQRGLARALWVLLSVLSRKRLVFGDKSGFMLLRSNSLIYFALGYFNVVVPTVLDPSTGRRHLRLSCLENLSWREPMARPLTDAEKQDLRTKLLQFVYEKGTRYIIDDLPSHDYRTCQSAIPDHPDDFRMSLLERLWRNLTLLSDHYLLFEDKSSITHTRDKPLRYRTRTQFEASIPAERDSSTGKIHLRLSSLEMLDWEMPVVRPLSIAEKRDLRMKLVRFVGEKWAPYVIDDLPVPS